MSLDNIGLKIEALAILAIAAPQAIYICIVYIMYEEISSMIYQELVSVSLDNIGLKIEAELFWQ